MAKTKRMGVADSQEQDATTTDHEIRVAGELIDWYEAVYAAGDKTCDPIFSLRGMGREIWADEDADAFVRRQREAWL